MIAPSSDRSDELSVLSARSIARSMSVFTGGCALALSAEGGAPAAEAPAAAIAVAKGVEPSAVAMAASTRSASGAPLSEATSALWSRTRGASHFGFSILTDVF